LRQLRPRTKERRNVSIPDELRESLREAFELIEQAKRSSDVALDFDDAIQAGSVCGGRFGKKRRPYVLTFSPQGGTERDRWFLTLDHTEIEDIADGHMAEISTYCCSPTDCRCKFREADEHCFYCDYTEDETYALMPIAEALERLAGLGINGLTANSTIQDVLAVLGMPDESSKGMKDSALGYVRPWIKYQLSECQVRFGFRKDQEVEDVTFLPKKWKPGD